MDKTLSDRQKRLLAELPGLRLSALREALEGQFAHPETYEGMCFEERLVELLESLKSERWRRRCETLLKKSRLRGQMLLDDIRTGEKRGFTGTLKAQISSLNWTREGQIRNIAALGPSGSGKTAILSAAGTFCAEAGLSVRYCKYTDLLTELTEDDKPARDRLRRELKKTKVLIMDDFGIMQCTDLGAGRLYEVLDDRMNVSPVVIGSQLTRQGIAKAVGGGTAVRDGIMRRLFGSCIEFTLKPEGPAEWLGPAPVPEAQAS